MLLIFFFPSICLLKSVACQSPVSGQAGPAPQPVVECLSGENQDGPHKEEEKQMGHGKHLAGRGVEAACIRIKGIGRPILE